MDFYLVCFLVGFALSVVSVLAGGAHVHVPHLHFDGLHMDAPDLHGAPHISHDLPFLNLGTVAAFLAWFGGTGYLLVRFSSIWTFFALGLALASGLAGAAVVFWFLVKVLMRSDEALDPADYDMVGVLGSLTVPIREGGTGELTYSQGGTRHCTAARSDDNKAIAKDAEVVVTRFEKGIAYVRRWEDLAGVGE
jgi:membrane protein implicated in regulation of membrane protease activity